MTIHVGLDIQVIRMNAKQKSNLIMVIVIALVAVLMAAMAWMIYSYGQGGLSEDSMYMLSTLLSGAMFLVVIVYAVYVESSKSKAELYKRFEEQSEEKKRP